MAIDLETQMIITIKLIQQLLWVQNADEWPSSESAATSVRHQQQQILIASKQSFNYDGHSGIFKFCVVAALWLLNSRQTNYFSTINHYLFLIKMWSINYVNAQLLLEWWDDKRCSWFDQSNSVLSNIFIPIIRRGIQSNQLIFNPPNGQTTELKRAILWGQFWFDHNRIWSNICTQKAY